MKKMTQAENNPFPYSDSNKRYYTYDFYLKRTYGGKCAKVTLDAGFTCPNIDGTCGVGGCIYCSARGSGDFAEDSRLSLTEQYRIQVEKIQKKWQTDKFIPYLQAHTNTYAPLAELQAVYDEAMALPGAVALHIATRADCLDAPVLSLLRDVSEKIPLTVELGLQTVSDRVAEYIGRGHDYATFLKGYTALRQAVPNARIAIHIINGLPYETAEDMETTAREVASLHPDEVKIHLLHVLKNTPLADLYTRGEYTPLSEQAYVDIAVKQLRILPPDTVIGRLTGDGGRDALLAPLWSLKKTVVINQIDKKMFQNSFLQGDLYKINKKI